MFIKLDLALLGLLIVAGIGVLAARRHLSRQRHRLLKTVGHRAFRRFD